MARGLPTGGQGSKVYVLHAEPKEHKHFRPGTQPGGSVTRPGGSVTGVTEKLFMCQMFMCLLRPLNNGSLFRRAPPASLRSISNYPNPKHLLGPKKKSKNNLARLFF